MSYFSIIDFIKSGRKSLEDKNYWSALSVALMLPSMCSRLNYQSQKDIPDNKDLDENGKPKFYCKTKQNGGIWWNDSKCYKDFCQELFNNNHWITSVLGTNYAEVLYQLRCDIVHAGCASIYTDNKGIYLSLGENNNTTEFTKHKVINIKTVTTMIFDHINIWLTTFGANGFKHTFVFDIDNNRDDRLLYNRLCDDDRADFLLKQFEKEERERKE